MNNKVIVPVLIGIIIIGGMAYASILRKSPTVNSPTAETASTISPASTSTDPNQPQSVASATASSKDCSTDMGCFIAQANTCGPASVEFTATILKGLTGTSHIVIGKSTKAGSCTFNQRTDKVTVRGQSDTSTVGTTIACPAIPSAKLAAILTNWNESTFSSEDFDGYNCKTTLPKALIDAMAKQDNTTPVDSQPDANTAHETFTGLGEGSSVGRNAYQFYVSTVTSNTATIKLTGPEVNNVLPPSVTVTLTLNVPQSYLGYSFTLTGVKYDYDEYIGTITVNQL
ncbi:MAG: hypothetical protein ABIO57_01900 [Candidatus Paceibacterota bacterium]